MAAAGGAGGAADPPGSGTGAVPCREARKVVPQRGQRIDSPAAGMRDSSMLYCASQLGQARVTGPSAWVRVFEAAFQAKIQLVTVDQ